jgi:alpha/beta superfamily hydrolase
MESLEKKIDDLSNVEKIFVYGTKDDDYDDIVPALKAMKKDKLKVLEVEGADHKFTGRLDEFISLTDML